jgi:hypothetical protein
MLIDEIDWSESDVPQSAAVSRRPGMPFILRDPRIETLQSLLAVARNVMRRRKAWTGLPDGNNCPNTMHIVKRRIPFE